MVLGIKTALSVWLILPHYWGKTFLSAVSDGPWILWISTLVGTNNIASLMWTLDFMQLSSPWHFVLWTLATLASPNSKLYLLNLGKYQAFHEFPLFAWRPRYFLKAVSWGNHRAHFLCFPNLMDHYSLLPDVVSFKPLFHLIFISIVFFFFGMYVCSCYFW